MVISTPIKNESKTKIPSAFFSSAPAGQPYSRCYPLARRTPLASHPSSGSPFPLMCRPPLPSSSTNSLASVLTPPPRRRHPPPLATRQPPSVLTCRPPLLSPSTNPVASVLMPPPRRHHPPFSPRDARRVSPDPEVRLHDPTLFSPQSASQSPIANSQPPTPPPTLIFKC
jgi:hypothetical protein